jgi:hypothetical protein
MRVTPSRTSAGETVARAKRTDRAEARRRYRAAAAATDTPDETEDEAPSTASAKSKGASSSSSSASKPVPGQRMSLGQAFRAAIRPVHVREDLAALPWIAVHTKALWVPLLITVAATVAVIITNGTDFVSAFLFAYFVQTPAIGGVFIAGFLAPRASWLLGVIVGFVAAVGYTIFIVVSTSRGTVALPTPGAAQDAIVSAFLLSPLLGAFFASAAAWYRRFLALSNPNRGQQKAAPKRGDGKTRSTGTSQKAPAKR